ncbi:ArnT family glycosyltransferase [Granulicella sibirica]|uniref:Glycosyl transferase, family 2 n=1 Tax=Granulicella sibirica TaxID=2479048 RepID=A0A4Q0TAU5_9BACT|nr:glycosyltransferase family 39 protein [Granulicella sibirica]RXH58771.1 glycosyl transferase, family 2 [Granulicella sibirica]
MDETPSRGKALAAFLRGDGAESRLPSRMFWTGFLIRLLYMTLAHGYRMRLIHDHFEFGWEMGRIARALATGYGFADPFTGHSGPTAWCPPLYPLLIAASFKLFGVYTALSSWAILAVNCIFSAATAPIIYKISIRTFGRDERGRSIALWSGWLWALYPAAMQYAVRWIWDMSITAFFFAWVILLALKVRGIGDPESSNPNRPQSWILFGTAWGIISLLNSSLLLALPAFCLWMAWDNLRVPRRIPIALRDITLAALACLALMTPWVIRNAYALHAFVPLRANFGAELCESVEPWNQGFPWGATVPIYESDPAFQRYARLGEVNYSKQQGLRANQIIRANPRRFVGHVLQRVYFFWSSVPHPIEKSVATEVIRELNFGFLSVSSLLGLALALRNRIPGAWLFFWAFALYPVLYYFITVQARFRHPLEPLICILSVYLFQSADRTRTWSWQKSPKRFA